MLHTGDLIRLGESCESRGWTNAGNRFSNVRIVTGVRCSSSPRQIPSVVRTRRFTSKELKAIQDFGNVLSSFRQKAKPSTIST